MERSRIRSTNGVDLEVLRETIEAVRELPSAARFRFRALSLWITGGRSRTRVQQFFGAGQERRHTRAFVMESDQPSIAMGTDRGANSIEYLLVALASCLITSLAYLAASRAVALQGIEVETTGTLDVRGFLGAAEFERSGCREFHVALTIATGASGEELEDLVATACERSPVFDMITRSTPVHVSVERGRCKPEKEKDDE